MAYRLLGAAGSPLSDPQSYSALEAGLRGGLEGSAILQVLGLERRGQARASDVPSTPAGKLLGPEEVLAECAFAALLLGPPLTGRHPSALVHLEGPRAVSRLGFSASQNHESLLRLLIAAAESCPNLPRPVASPSSPRHGKQVVLVGPMGSGKSATGSRLAALLGRPFLDTDSIVERTAGKPIRDIFRDEGEARFRDWESAALESSLEVEDAVIATGGGAVLGRMNRNRLLGAGSVVWLHASPATLAARLSSAREAEAIASRPLLEEGDPLPRLSSLYGERLPYYAAVSSHLLPTSGRSAQHLAELLRDALLPAG